MAADPTDPAAPSLLRLFGRLVKQRVREFVGEARTEVKDGYAEFRSELDRELEDDAERNVQGKGGADPL